MIMIMTVIITILLLLPQAPARR